ncbi:MAG: Lar family restriction alleviation protein [Limisphaerales bacterium]
METIGHATTDQTELPTPVLKACPFCAGRAEVITTQEPTKYGVWCCTCHGGFLPVLETQGEAVILWNRRSGGVSAAGGRGTKGILTRKKRRACRKKLGAGQEGEAAEEDQI